MTIQFEEEGITFIEEDTKIEFLTSGFLFILISTVILWTRRFTSVSSSINSYLLIGGGLGIVLGIAVIYSGFRRKERIFQFTPSVVHINDKNTGNKILDLPKSIINRVEKHITMKSEDNEEKPKLNHIIYDLEFEGKEMSFKYHTLNSNPLEESEALDQFLSQNYGVQVDIDQQFINKT